MFMQYKAETAETAVQLLLEFIKEGQILRQQQAESFDKYSKDPEVQMFFDNIVKPAAEVSILESPDALVFCPNPDNRWLGHSNEELRQKMIGGANPTNTDLYLGYFVILCLFAELFGSDYFSEEGLDNAVNFVKIAKLVQTVDENLQSIIEGSPEDVSALEKETETNLALIARHWHDKQEFNPQNKRQNPNTKVGFVLRVCQFLVQEGLVNVQGDREVHVREKARLMVRKYYGDSQRKEKLIRYILQEEAMQ